MPLYSFYKLVAKTNAESDIYIGHTTSPLYKRKWKHKKEKNCSSRILFQAYGDDGVEIILIHQLELPNREEARKEERRLVEENKEKCVNLRRAYRSHEEHREEHKTRMKERYATDEALRETYKARAKAHYYAKKANK